MAGSWVMVERGGGATALEISEIVQQCGAVGLLLVRCARTRIPTQPTWPFLSATNGRWRHHFRFRSTDHSP